jgi:hypothetical protein
MLFNVLFAGIVFGLLFDHERGGSQAPTNEKCDFQVSLLVIVIVIYFEFQIIQYNRLQTIGYRTCQWIIK